MVDVPPLTATSVASKRRRKMRNVARDVMAELQSNVIAAKGIGPEASGLIAATDVLLDAVEALRWTLMKRTAERLSQNGSGTIVSRRWPRIF
jgi:hypothetical protein